MILIRSQSESRAGTVLICVLACLVIVIAMVMTTVQSAIRGRVEVRKQRQLLQTELLCEAGVKRAVEQIRKSVEYRGEKWIPKYLSSFFEHAVIEIKIEPSLDDANSMRAEIVASLASSSNSHDRMQRSHAFVINLSPSATDPK